MSYIVLEEKEKSMKSILAKLAIGTAALLVAGTVVATAANAKVSTVGTIGEFVVLADPEVKACALGIAGGQSSLVIIHSGVTHETGLMYQNPAIGNIKGQQFVATVVIDDKEYDWKATGLENGFEIITPDTAFPPALIKAEKFGVMVNDNPVFSLGSGPNFEAAMNATLKCAHQLGTPTK